MIENQFKVAIKPAFALLLLSTVLPVARAQTFDLLHLPSEHQSQDFDLQNRRIPVTSLNGLWRFHTGDDPAWAEPGFDDSSWSLLHSYEPWANQGFRGYSGVAWYRFRVIVPPDIAPLAIELPRINTCYQLFGDGKLIGTYGKMPPHPEPWADGVKHVYEVPGTPQLSTQNRTITFALRVWEWPVYANLYGGGPLFRGALIGDSSYVNSLDDQYLAVAHWARSSTGILAILETLAALGSFALFLLRRSEREYLWFCLIMLFSALAEWLKLSYNFTLWPIVLHNQIEAALLGPCLMLAEIAFYFHFLRGRRTPLFWLALTSTLTSIPFDILGGLLEINISGWYLGQDLLRLPTYLWILALLFTRARRNFVDARLLVTPVLLQKATLIFQQWSVLTFSLGWQSRFSYWITITNHPFEIQLVQVVDALFLLTMLFILVFRFSRTRSRAELYASEVEGARSVQQFLIPQQMPTIPGLAFQSEYRPAREVGGDFFQIIPDVLDGSTLIVLGDVAGKGLQAGMLATLIVGALRTAATFTSDPIQIIHTLNNRLIHRGNATCVALRIAVDGSATLVNAGHLPPYWNGSEMSVEGSLPLGILPGMDFPVQSFHLQGGDELMLMSDGVAEAQDHDGHLFGFSRITEMLGRHATATELADAAQKFGQSDDITVLTIACAVRL